VAKRGLAISTTLGAAQRRLPHWRSQAIAFAKADFNIDAVRRPWNRPDSRKLENLARNVRTAVGIASAFAIRSSGLASGSRP